VSRARQEKDYSSSPLNHAVKGTQELWVFNPHLAGPRTQGERFRLQRWGRHAGGDLVRVYAGDGPMRSEVLGAWVFAVDEGRSLAIADDQAGTRWWLTPEEAARADAERERQAKKAILRRVAELEALLKTKG
jgi:hypothetical protein